MEWLNYHHLLYFWLVAREGGLARAAAKLRLAPPTVSVQVRRLEESLGEKLFERRGRRLVLTEMGRLVHRYADEIFSLGSELLDTVHGRPTGQPLRLVVGVADVVPKLIARRLLRPAQHLGHPVRIVVYEDKPERLLAELASHALDLVLSDAPVGAGAEVRAYSHPLGESDVGFFGTPALARRYRPGFPESLDGAPFLLPVETTMLRRSLEQWFARRRIRPLIVGEFEDSALLAAFGQEGLGLFAAPTAIAREVQQLYEVRRVGRASSLRERFYALTIERRLKHPAVVAICEAARRTITRED